MLKAGWSAIEITPPAGIDLSGFAGRGGPNVGVHDRLFAKAVHVSDGRERVGLITADLVGLDAGTVAEVRGEVARRLGSQAPALMIACSHTHSGPATPCLPFIGQPNPEYLVELNRRLVEVAVQAAGRLREAEVAAGRAQALVGINRRARRTDGSIALGRNEAGTVAPYVEVVRFATEDGAALLFSHAAHPVTLGGDNLLVSADWPGYAQRFIEEACDKPCVALFAQGCCGNINSDPRGTFEIAERQGRVIADGVLSAVGGLAAVGDGPVASASAVLQLPLEDPPPIEEARAMLKAAERDLAMGEGVDQYGVRKSKQGMVDWARRILDLSNSGARDLTQPFEVQVLRIGEVAMVGLPGEVFVEYQQQIKAGSPFAHTLVFGYANGDIGYVPTAAAFPEGGYEVEGAIRYYGETMLTPECERLVVEAARDMLAALGGR
jgi:neutral ceramidase